MRSRTLARTAGSVIGWVGFALAAAAQQPHTAPDLATSIEAKRMEIRHHTEQMQSIHDTAALQHEMQRHFVMVEEMLAAMLEQQKHAMPSAVSASGAMPMEGEMAMEGEMPSTPPTTARGMGGGGMGGMHGEHEMGMGGMGAGSAASPAGGAADVAQRIAQREALLAEITQHSRMLESLTDAETRTRELVRHQEMLDRLLDLMR